MSYLLHQTRKSLSTLLIVLLPTLVQADEEQVLDFKALEQWKVDRLFHPSAEQRENERSGYITIYDGLTDKTVDQAMDLHYARIENMMFTGVVITDDTGQPRHDPDDGEIMIEDDGC